MICHMSWCSDEMNAHVPRIQFIWNFGIWLDLRDQLLSYLLAYLLSSPAPLKAVHRLVVLACGWRSAPILRDRKSDRIERHHVPCVARQPPESSGQETSSPAAAVRVSQS